MSVAFFAALYLFFRCVFVISLGVWSMGFGLYLRDVVWRVRLRAFLLSCPVLFSCLARSHPLPRCVVCCLVVRILRDFRLVASGGGVIVGGVFIVGVLVVIGY